MMTTLIRKRAQMPRAPLTNCHEGRGELDWTVVLDGAEVPRGRVRFIHDDVMPPGASIGVHRHTDDEEHYFIVSGAGEMTLDGRRLSVGPGDLTVVYPGGEHGLENTGSEPLRLLVISVQATP